MSGVKKLQQVPACYGEGFEENFFFSSIMSDSVVSTADYESTKHYKEYVGCSFLKEMMVKTKFSTSKSTLDSSCLQSTAADKSTPRKRKKWGWSAV